MHQLTPSSEIRKTWDVLSVCVSYESADAAAAATTMLQGPRSTDYLAEGQKHEGAGEAAKEGVPDVWLPFCPVRHTGV